MAEVKNVATRDSYGTALKELAADGADNLVVLDADLSAATKQVFSRKIIQTDISTAVLQRLIWFPLLPA